MSICDSFVVDDDDDAFMVAAVVRLLLILIGGCGAVDDAFTCVFDAFFVCCLF